MAETTARLSQRMQQQITVEDSLDPGTQTAPCCSMLTEMNDDHMATPHQNSNSEIFVDDVTLCAVSTLPEQGQYIQLALHEHQG